MRDDGLTEHVTSWSDRAFAKIGAMPLRGLEVDSLDESIRRRLHELTIVLLAVLVVGPIQAARYALLGVWPVAISIVAGGVLMLGNLWVLRRTRSPVLVGGLGVAILSLQLIVNVAASGGFYDPMFSWLYVLPVAATLMVGPRTTWLVTAGVAAVAVVFWQLHDSGVLLTNMLPEHVQASQSLVNRVSALSTIGVLLAASNAQRAFVTSLLEDANAKLATETHTQRELRERASAAQYEAEVANAAKNRFLANLSHELRTPLNTIMGYSELILEEQGVEDPMSDDAAHILGAAVHLSHLFETLFFLTSLESGSLEVAPTDFAPRESLSGLLAEFEGLAAQKGLALELECPEDLHARTDPALLLHLLRGLLDNALKFTHEGHVRLVAALDECSGEVCFSVEDTGEGMSEEARARAL